MKGASVPIESFILLFHITFESNLVHTGRHQIDSVRLLFLLYEYRTCRNNYIRDKHGTLKANKSNIETSNVRTQRKITLNTGQVDLYVYNIM